MSLLDETKQFAQLIRAGLSFDPENPPFEAVAEGIVAGKYQLWPGTQSVAVTEIHQHPEGLTCHIWLAAGDLAELESMFPACEAWARSIGCARMSILGREGWGRAWPRHAGFRPLSTTFVKRL